MAAQFKNRLRAVSGPLHNQKRSRWSEFRTALLRRELIELNSEVEDKDAVKARPHWRGTGTAIVRRDAIENRSPLNKGRLVFIAKLSAVVISAVVFGFLWVNMPDGIVETSKAANQQKINTKEPTRDAATDFRLPIHYQAWLSEIPESQIKSWRRHAWRLIRNKHFRLAIEKLKTWLKKAPYDAKLNFLYGQALYSLSKNNVNKTKEHFEKAIQLDPKDVELKYQLGWFYFHIKEFDQAFGLLAEVNKVQPGYKSVQSLLRKSRQLAEK